MTVARKQHQCAACLQPIIPGESYWSESYGPWMSYRCEAAWTCRMCAWCAPRVIARLDEEGWDSDDLPEAMHDIRAEWKERLEREGLAPILEEVRPWRG